MHATALAFRALGTGNELMEKKARTFYVAGLRSHRTELLRIVGHGSRRPSSEPVPHNRPGGRALLILLVIAMLQLQFEMMQPSASNSWWGHAHGAAQLLEMLGPESCQQPLIYEMFLVLRYALVSLPLRC